MAIECNPNICNEDAELVKIDQGNHRTLRTLTKYSVQVELIRDCLKVSYANPIPLLVWTRASDSSSTTGHHYPVQHATTWLSSRCERITLIRTNHEGTFFVDFIVPIFQYFHDQIQYLQFQW